MSDLKENLTNSVKKIDATISNPDEKKEVLKIIEDMIADFTKQIIDLTERQDDLENEIVELHENVTEMCYDISAAMGKSIELECPFCHETFEFSPKSVMNDEADVCPHCGKEIDLEELLLEQYDDCDCDCDDEEDGCSGDCKHCGGGCFDEE